MTVARAGARPLGARGGAKSRLATAVSLELHLARSPPRAVLAATSADFRRLSRPLRTTIPAAAPTIPAPFGVDLRWVRLDGD
jgi:hypothetical protein